MPAVTEAPSFPVPRWTAWVRLSDLRPAIRNPKKHDLPALIESITIHGFTVAVLWCERVERLAAGHGRLAALVSMKTNGDPLPEGLVLDDDGEWVVPVARGWSSKDDAHLEAYIVADNRLTEAGGWDDRILAEMLHDVHAADPALFDGIGFTAEELDEVFKSIDPELFDKDPDALPSGPGGGGGDAALDEGDAVPAGKPVPTRVACPMCDHHFNPADAETVL